jgi:hypothetical protein
MFLLKHAVRIAPVFLYLTSYVAAGQAQNSTEQLFNLIKEKTLWKVDPAENVYTPSTLTQFSPEKAAVYLEYGFVRLSTRNLTLGSEKIQMELYEMVDAPAAYGVFTYFREPQSKPVKKVGTEGELTADRLNFQKGKYFVRLTCIRETNHCVSHLLKLGQVISDPLPDSSTLPAVVLKLPNEERMPQSEVFLMGPKAMDRFVPLQGKDPFGLNVGAEAAFARYVAGPESASVLLIDYPNQQLAKKFLQAGYHEYSIQRPGQPIYFKRDGPLVTLVMDTSTPAFATSLLDKTGYVSLVIFDPKVQPVNIARVMLNIFIYCGVLLGITLAAGILFGIVRVLLKRYFPGKVFDRDVTAKVLQLDLGMKEPPFENPPPSSIPKPT